MTGDASVAGESTKLEGRLFVSVEEVANFFGVGRSTAYEAVRRGEIPARRLGRRIMVPVAPLVRWFEEGEVKLGVVAHEQNGSGGSQ